MKPQVCKEEYLALGKKVAMLTWPRGTPIKQKKVPILVVHTHNPSYSGGRGGKILSLRPVWDT
jgi:hypothetical protein